MRRIAINRKLCEREMKRSLFFIWILTLVVGSAIPSKASHVVGGEVTYKCLGGNRYEITISLYEDCLTGLPEAIAQDDPAYLNIFDGTGRPMFIDSSFNPPHSAYDSIRLGSRTTVPANFSNLCVNNPPVTCLRKAVFTKVYTLPPNTTGYTVVYQRCCRNASILNIINPASVGATYYCNIPPAGLATCNNSAVFKNYPPQIICINNPLIYDHSAIDPDGDSLSYEFCNTYEGGSNNDAKPIPSPPPFDTVTYIKPYSYKNPMGGYPRIAIDSKTGIISGMPNVLGRYVVTVCCHEWRNGVMINTVTREFQFVVTNCSKAVFADIPQFSNDFNTYIVNCNDYTVHFTNTSKGGFDYYWYFGDTINKATSSEFEPTYTYPDTGTFLVTLVVNRGSTCPDSISRFVKIYPKFKSLYSYSGLQCPGSEISFKDLTSSTYKPITSWFWDFGDSVQSAEQNPVHTYTHGDTYNVLFVSKNYKGCTDTALKQILVEKFIPFAGNDTTIVKGETISFDAGGGIQYSWTPNTYLSNTDGFNPIGHFTDTGRFTYKVHVVSPFGCVGDDTLNILVVNQAAAFVPSGFTPNGDGRNDVLRPILIGYRNIDVFNIYNRYGQIVFHTDMINDGWDGTFGGKLAEVGTYFWLLKVVDRFGNESIMKGDVTLLR